MDKISIIIPIYNCEEYLTECFDSVVNQTYKNIEVVMVNDGTKDKSDLICKKYEKNYNWQFIDRKVNKGLAYTRNEGIKKSTGKYIMFLDSDDLLYEDAVECLYNCLKKNKSDLVISKINSFNSKGNYGYYSDRYLRNEIVGNINDNKKLINCISVCGKLYKKELLKDINFIEGTYHEDNYFTLKVLFNSKKISTLSIYTYYRRIREGDNKSIMQDLNYRTFSDLLKNFKTFLDENKYYKNSNFIYSFMMRKSINYIVMNIDNKDYRKCENEFNEFKEYLYKYKNMNMFEKVLFELKYFLYFLLAKSYKLLKSMKK